MAETADIVVIGAGMAGAAAAYELSHHGRVILLEREDQPGYHSTGRSAATLIEIYGNPVVRALTRASRRFLESPPDGFGDGSLLGPRGLVVIARDDQLPVLERELAAAGAEVARVDGNQAAELVPVLRPDYVAAAMVDRGAADIDVHALHQGYLRGFRRRGGRVVSGAEVAGLSRSGGTWRIETAAGHFEAPVVVDAAGAWADAVAGLAGVRPLGLQPMRRTAITFDGPADIDSRAWPMVEDVEEQFYFKPESGRLLGSPADESPSAPTDAQPEEIDVATAVDRIERATTMSIRRIEHRWAGLRSFVADRAPVAGAAVDAEGFYWLAGQGGSGIMTAPALAWAVAAAVDGAPLPTALREHGLAVDALSPARLAAPARATA